MGVTIDAQRLRRELARRGLTSVELAAMSHVSAATLSHALSGRAVSPRTLRAIASALQQVPVCADELLGG